MIGDFLSIRGALGAFLLSVVVFGLAPGFVLAVIVRMIPDPDRRAELQAELYDIPRWEQPYWVAQQLEVAVRIGVLPEMGWQFGRHVWHRAKIESGAEYARRYPDTFSVPDDEDKADLRAGDRVKLMWSVRGRPGERMWVTITHRDDDKMVGVLDNYAIMANLYPEEVIKFRVDDIIDCILEDDEDAEAA